MSSNYKNVKIVNHCYTKSLSDTSRTSVIRSEDKNNRAQIVNLVMEYSSSADNFSFLTVFATIIAGLATTAVFSTYVFSSLLFMQQVHISHSLWAILIYMSLPVAAILLIACMGVDVFEFYKNPFENIKKLFFGQKKKGDKIPKIAVLCICLASICVCGAYGTLAGTSIASFLGNNHSALCVVNAILFGGGISLGLIPFIAVPAVGFCVKIHKKKRNNPKLSVCTAVSNELNWRKLGGTLVGESCLMPILVLYVNKEFDKRFSSLMSNIFSWLLVIGTVLIIAIAIQNKNEENEEKQSKENIGKSPRLVGWKQRLVEWRQRIIKYLLLFMMGAVGGSCATYVGFTELEKHQLKGFKKIIPGGGHTLHILNIVLALFPIIYWAALYNDGPGTIFKFFREKRFLKCLTPSNYQKMVGGCGLLVACFTFGAGLVIAFASCSKEIPLQVWWTIAWISFVVGCVAAGLVAKFYSDPEANKNEACVLENAIFQ